MLQNEQELAQVGRKNSVSRMTHMKLALYEREILRITRSQHLYWHESDKYSRSVALMWRAGVVTGVIDHKYNCKADPEGLIYVS